jgi:type I restriction enzyme R subunit
MVFYAGQMITHPQMKNPTIVMLTDRNDLDDQLFSTFGHCKQLLRQTPVQAESREHIKELLKVLGGGQHYYGRIFHLWMGNHLPCIKNH